MPTLNFSRVADDLARLRAEREALVASAFDDLQALRPSLADMLIERMNTPQRAARWMASSHRAADHRTPWELLAEGNEDEVWDLLDPPDEADINVTERR
jgi:hypothetical protein